MIGTINPFLLADAYKVSHPEQYPDGTEYVYSNTTPRKSRNPGYNGVIVFGLRYFIREYLVQTFTVGFFARPWSHVEEELDEFYTSYFGTKPDLSRHKALHDHGSLPLHIKALPEGTLCPIGVPFMTIINTNPEFYWLTNFIETLTQTVVWNMTTAATTARAYRELLDKYAMITTGTTDAVKFQGHNFSMRGMSSVESAITTDFAHLLSFVGSDTLAGGYLIKDYYSTEEGELISCSVPATEHAVMCAGGAADERETFRRLICDTYPSGIVSIVSDTWDLWKVLNEIAPSLKTEIEARDGRVTFRPDSGCPVRIICGYEVYPVTFDSEYVKSRAGTMSFDLKYFHRESAALLCTDGKIVNSKGEVISEEEALGCIRLLDKHFGSTVNSKGYKELNPKIGLIYGDSITLERAHNICQGLKDLGYASTNIVLGIGSYTYQYVTRDTFSIACKATWVQVSGEARSIFKDPITDDGTKKSACGLLKVYKDESGNIKLKDNATKEEEEESLLQTVFLNGVSESRPSFSYIRHRVASQPTVRNLPYMAH